jgi:hypothetical protein
MLLALLAMVAAVLWLNSLIAVFSIPQLIKTFLGIETAFSRAGIWVMFNTTFLAVTIALAWLAFDPLLKTVYTLRCFHGEARTDGADLLAELSRVRANGKGLAAAALALLLLFPVCAGATDVKNPPAASVPFSAAVPPSEIEDAVKKTLLQEKYAWRLPREKIADENNAAHGWLGTFFSSIANTLMDWMRAIRDWLRSILEWFDKHFAPKQKPVEPGGSHSIDWAGLMRWFAYGLLLFAGTALALLVVRFWRQGWKRSDLIVTAEVISARPDLNDENVTAAQLPEDGWLKLAREMLERGELRLALRALYLATLAHLATREIVSIARFKSNRDYEIEVNRRARGSMEMRVAFSDNVKSFDRAWYGLHDVNADALARFQSNFDRIRAC